MFTLTNIKYKNILNIKNLSIPTGKITCIVGPSGCGKTTLLKMLNKLISPDSGTISYCNNTLKEINSINLRRQIVMLPQEPAIFPGTIKNNLQLGLNFSEKLQATDNQLLEVLQTVHLNKNLTHDAEKLSGGEKQRLALGRVILMNPEVYLLDEPSSALDEETEQLVIEKTVTKTRETSKTLIMVTHAKQIAKTYADNIIQMKNGQVLAGKE